jgi:hypothetical protein
VIKHRQFTKGQKIFVIMGIFVCGLLFYANGVASNLISAPTYVGDIITFSALTVAVALTVITLTIVIRDKRRSLFAKKQKSIVANSDKESIEIPSSVLSSVDSQENTDKVESDIVAVAKVFGKRNLFVIIVVLVVGLLLVANAGAFGLISLPQYSIYATLAGAIAIATIPLTILLSDKIKALGHRIKNFWAEPDIQEIIKEVKEPDQVPDIAPVIAQTSTIKVDPYTEMLRQFRVQKTSRKFEADNAEQEQLPKKPVIPPTKVICPACRKEFSLPIYERNYIVDFGQPKRSNPIERCPHCQTSIPLKRRGAVEEDDMWKD